MATFHRLGSALENEFFGLFLRNAAKRVASIT
jgi:hypothetical protein